MSDLISRQAAIDALAEFLYYPNNWDGMRAGFDLSDWKWKIECILSDLPSAEPKPWEYDEDCGCVMCRCPKCSGRMTISLYQYKNPYQFCPYCGQALTEGKLAQKRKQVYGEGVRRNDNNQE